MRKHLIQKIIQTIFPTPDENTYKDARMSSLVQYAYRTEYEMYEQAKDQEDYFHLLAERIYKIQKELEEKRFARNKQQQQQQQPIIANGPGLLYSSQMSKPYDPDLSAGNEGPPNKVAPIDAKSQITPLNPAIKQVMLL